MREYPLLKDYEFTGKLRDICAEYVAEKRALGCIFNTESKKLKEFSRMSEDFDFPENTLTEDVVKAWLSHRPNDSGKTIYHRCEIIKGLSQYMLRMGLSAYCPQFGDIPKIQWYTFVPYTFTHDEILRFFATMDAMKKGKYSNSHRRHIVMPVLFRLLYCCGLRVSEVIGLKACDVNFEEQILIIRDSKFEKSRYVPMSDEMAETLKKYTDANIHEPYLFPSRDGGKYSENTVYDMFRQTLFAAGISHGGRGKGPRVHDFRHTFSVHCLQKWIRAGVPLSSALPRLSTYLGHNNLAATERYLHMSAEVYPEISVMLSQEYGHLIPKEVTL